MTTESVKPWPAWDGEVTCWTWQDGVMELWLMAIQDHTSSLLTRLEIEYAEVEAEMEAEMAQDLPGEIARWARAQVKRENERLLAEAVRGVVAERSNLEVRLERLLSALRYIRDASPEYAKMRAVAALADDARRT